MKRIGVLTTSRSDYGIFLPLLRSIDEDPDLELLLIVSGTHLSPEFGLTVEAIEADGFEIAERVAMLLSSDTPEGIAKSMGLGTIGYGQALARLRPDILVLLGDRFETHAAAVAALPFKIPVAHLHGGELTQGAIDDALRHSLTKLSHLHFVATEEYFSRVVQMGEEPWRVTNCGALSLDNLQTIDLLDTNRLEVDYGLKLDRPMLLVTFHPVTLEYERTQWQFQELLAALEVLGMPVVFTSPNADTAGRVILRLIDEFTELHPWAMFVANMGMQGYFSLLSVAAAMVGNSSSGLLEAPSFGLPVVNIGTRQDGRVRAANVIDVGYRRTEIVEGVERALDPNFRAKLADLVNPYGKGNAAVIIIERLKTGVPDDRLLRKRFHDLDVSLPNGD